MFAWSCSGKCQEKVGLSVFAESLSFVRTNRSDLVNVGKLRQVFL